MYVAAGDPVRSHAGQPGGNCGERWTKIACSRTLINWPTRHVGDGEDMGIFGCCLSVFLQRSLPARSHRFQTPHHRFPQSGRSVQILSEEHPGMIWVCFGCQHAWGALEVLIWVTPGKWPSQRRLSCHCSAAPSPPVHIPPQSVTDKCAFKISSSFSSGLIRLYFVKPVNVKRIFFTLGW